MDSSQSHHHHHHHHENQNQNNNWLAFSLSNTNTNNNNNNNNTTSFFQHPHATPNFHPIHHEIDTTTGPTTTNSHHELSILTDGSPKLEDFLGGCCSAASAGSACHFPDDQSQSSVQPHDTTTTTTTTAASIYDSELKSFLRGFSTDTHQAVITSPPPPQQQQNQDSPPAKKAVDTFGQRTVKHKGISVIIISRSFKGQNQGTKSRDLGRKFHSSATPRND